MEFRKKNQIELDSRDYLARSDEQLAGLVAEGNTQALETLYDRYSRQAIGLAYRIVEQAELAEEVAQEAFLRFWERPDLYQPERGRFAGWLLSVIHHRAVNERRRSSFRLNVSADKPFSADGGDEADEPLLLSRLSDNAPGPDEQVLAQAQREVVRDALGQLSYPQRQVIELAYYSGLNQSEIAQQLGEPLGTVKTRLRLGMQKLRIFLNKKELVELVSEKD